VRLTRYLKAAFLNRWNLLAFLGGLGFAAIVSWGVLWPLVVAGEIAYLGLLGTHPKFQDYVDAQEAKSTRVDNTVQQETTLRQIVGSLPKKALARFEAVRSRCLELRQIATQLKEPGKAGPAPLDNLQVAGLDRLLWIYLRLLYTQFSLERFFETTSEAPIQEDIRRLDARLKALEGAGDSPQQQKARATIEDTLTTSRDRLTNLKKAHDTYELLQLELDRLESKIHSLSELAVNRQEPDFITAQVDQVATSMVETEKTMNDLQFATGLHSVDDEAPQLLQRPTVTVRGG